MKVPRFLCLSIFITVLCLLHVYQQTEIFQYAYAGQKRIVLMQDLLDKNFLLRYNIDKNTSLTRLGDKIYESKEFEIPDNYRLIRLPQPDKGVTLAARAESNKESIFARFFGVTRQAEAKTINHQ